MYRMKETKNLAEENYYRKSTELGDKGHLINVSIEILKNILTW